MTGGELLVVGPRELPESGTVQVLIDVGSGPAVQRVLVSAKDLRVSEHDKGHGGSAIYVLCRVPLGLSGPRR